MFKVILIRNYAFNRETKKSREIFKTDPDCGSFLFHNYHLCDKTCSRKNSFYSNVFCKNGDCCLKRQTVLLKYSRVRKNVKIPNKRP